MTIALVAHDSKKELMVQFCTAYRQILEQHHLIATGTTGRLVEENTGLSVQKFLPGGHGGGQQIMARIACDEVDMLLFFRDPIAAKPSERQIVGASNARPWELVSTQNCTGGYGIRPYALQNIAISLLRRGAFHMLPYGLAPTPNYAGEQCSPLQKQFTLYALSSS